MTTLQDLRHDVTHKVTDTLHTLRDRLEQVDLNRLRDQALNQASNVNLNRMASESVSRLSDLDISKQLSDALSRLDLAQYSRINPREVMQAPNRRAFHPAHLAVGLTIGLGLGLVAGVIRASSRARHQEEKQAAVRLDSALSHEKEPVTDF
jgi:hypothetical protein